MPLLWAGRRTKLLSTVPTTCKFNKSINTAVKRFSEWRQHCVHAQPCCLLAFYIKCCLCAAARGSITIYSSMTQYGSITYYGSMLWAGRRTKLLSTVPNTCSHFNTAAHGSIKTMAA
jgi:hypothetical protein